MEVQGCRWMHRRMVTGRRTLRQGLFSQETAVTMQVRNKESLSQAMGYTQETEYRNKKERGPVVLRGKNTASKRCEEEEAAFAI